MYILYSLCVSVCDSTDVQCFVFPWYYSFGFHNIKKYTNKFNIDKLSRIEYG